MQLGRFTISVAHPEARTRVFKSLILFSGIGPNSIAPRPFFHSGKRATPIRAAAISRVKSPRHDGLPLTAIRQCVVLGGGGSPHDASRRPDASTMAWAKLTVRFSEPDKSYSSVRIKIISPISANNMNGPHAARKGE